MVLYEKNNVIVRTIEEKDILYVLKYFDENSFNCDFETSSLRPSAYQFEEIIRKIINGECKTEAVLVLEKNNICIGYLSCYISYSNMYLGHIAVKKEERSKGYGKLLTLIALKIASNENRDVFLTCYYRKNRYLRSLGFTSSDNIHFMWNGQKEKNDFPIIFMTNEEYEEMREKEMEKEDEEWSDFLESDLMMRLGKYL